MEPAATIITKLGGSAQVAEVVGRHRTQIARWRWPKDRGGTDGRVPQEHIPALLAAAKEQRIPLVIGDFFPEMAEAL